MSVSTEQELAQAVAMLRRGGLVVFPTETVYGLGADAERPAAVRRVYEIKGRPADHPLIVHIGEAAELPQWAREVPRPALELAAAFWPGPLTLVLKRSLRVPLLTTGGLDTVALRVPAHPLALELLRRFEGGIAAPSANRFGRVSPTRAEHVRADLGGGLDPATDTILDGGPCSVGVESTIVDLSGEVPILLRPGGVTSEAIESVLGRELARSVKPGTRAPGRLDQHYAPEARVELISREGLPTRTRELLAASERVAVLVHTPEEAALLPEGALMISLGEREELVANKLYGALRDADARASVILVTPPAPRGLGEAIADRLQKAAGSAALK